MSGYADQFDKWNGKTAFVESQLEKPLHWKKPRRIFVCSMGDLFHESVPDEWIYRVWMRMFNNPQHTWMVLTKRPERMAEFFGDGKNVHENIWLGVTAENQQVADERIPILMQIPAAVRFVSVEPMLGPVFLYPPILGTVAEEKETSDRFIHWVICGGESGPGARPMHPDWARSLRDQCNESGTPFFFKQWGDYCWPEQMPEDTYSAVDAAHNLAGYVNRPWKVGKKKAAIGAYLYETLEE